MELEAERHQEVVATQKKAIEEKETVVTGQNTKIDELQATIKELKQNYTEKMKQTEG